jgi:hypothetical protein
MNSRNVRFVKAIVLLASLVLLMLPGVAQSQYVIPDSVTPPGEGTEADPFLISQLGHLVWMGETVGASAGMYYTLQNDLDASGTTNWNNGSGFAPIGNDSVKFMGCFDGNGKVISGLRINRPSQNFVGLIGFADNGSVVKNLGLSGGAVTGASCVGGLAGYNSGTITGCRATGPVTGISSVGGLVGLNQYGALSRCYAAGSVNGSGNYVGGLAGGNDQSGGTVNECYATGAVTGNTYVGGLVGANSNGGSVDHSYAAGPVQGVSFVGGLLGYNDSAVAHSYWDADAAGLDDSAGGTGMTTAQMKQQATFAGWDFTNVWFITEAVTYPLLVNVSGTGVEPPQPGQLRLSASAYVASEGVARKIVVQRINGSNGTVSVNYVVKPQTALAWKDYTPLSGTLTWTNGQTASKALKIPIRADGKVEKNETFLFVLKNPVGTTLVTPLRATITIQANAKGIGP